MGAPAGCTFALIESTPCRLRYLLTASGTANPTAIPNDLDVTPDLRTDLCAAAGPLRELLETQITAHATAEARRLLCGEQNSGAPSIAHVVRAHTSVTPIYPADAWGVDADEGSNVLIASSENYAVVVVYPSATLNATAYLDIVVTPSPAA
jgi:hypothetical protein